VRAISVQDVLHLTAAVTATAASCDGHGRQVASVYRAGSAVPGRLMDDTLCAHCYGSEGRCVGALQEVKRHAIGILDLEVPAPWLIRHRCRDGDASRA
jgi:hypothetical protein